MYIKIAFIYFHNAKTAYKHNMYKGERGENIMMNQPFRIRFMEKTETILL